MNEWIVKWQLRKYDGKKLLEVIDIDGNELMRAGKATMLASAGGLSGTDPATSIPYPASPLFDAANAWIGVGDGTDPTDPLQVALQGVNTAFVGMDPGFPRLSGAMELQFKATFPRFGFAAFDWEEFGIFNADGGVMMNRRVESLGSKPGNQTWVFTVGVTIGGATAVLNNDAFPGIPVGPLTWSWDSSNAGYTSEPGEVFYASGMRTAWFRFEPLASGNYQFDTIGSSFDTVMQVFTSPDEPTPTVPTLFLVNSDDDSGGNLTSLITVAATLGEVYYIQVAGYSNGTGSYSFNVQEV